MLGVIWEPRLHRNGASRRVDTIVGDRQFARAEHGARLLAQRLGGHGPCEGAGGVGESLEVALGNAERHRDRRDLVEHDDPGRIARHHDVARIGQPDPQSAGHGGGDAAIVHVHLGGGDSALVGANRALVLFDKGRLIVARLLGDRVLGGEGVEAGEVGGGFEQQGLIAGERPLGLRQDGPERPAIDLGKQRALRHVRPLG